MKRRLRWLGSLATVLLCLVFGPAAVPLVAGKAVLPSPEYQEPFAVLGHGIAAGKRWAVLLYRHNGRPCLDLTVKTEGLASCEHPLPVLVPQIIAGGRKGLTLVAALATQRVARVGFETDMGRERTGYLSALGAHRADRAHVSPNLRFGVRLFRNGLCVRRYSAYQENGRQLFQSEIHDC